MDQPTDGPTKKWLIESRSTRLKTGFKPTKIFTFPVYQKSGAMYKIEYCYIDKKHT